jgi:hypothetical protein
VIGNLMAIDPGLQGTGFAIWERDHPRVPQLTGVVRGDGGKNWMRRVDRIAQEVADLADNYGVRLIVCEMMEMQQSARAKMAWSGDLQRTLVLIGTIHGLTKSFCPTFTLTPPSEWKGQLPKSVTIRRVQKCVGRDNCERLGIKTHAWDAVGIGLWYQGLIT